MHCTSLLRLKVKGRMGGQRGREKKQVEEESMKVGLRRKDALCRSKRSVSANKNAAELR